MTITINIPDELQPTLEYLASGQEVTNEQILEKTCNTYLEAARRDVFFSKISTLKADDLVAVEEVVNTKYEEVQARTVDLEAQVEEVLAQEVKIEEVAVEVK